MVSPGREISQPGLVLSAKGPVSRILSCAVIPLGAALPRTLISDLPGGSGNCSSHLGASGRYATPPDSWRQLPSLFGLAPCGVYPASGFTTGAVRSYRTISPLPRRRASKLARGGPLPERSGVAEAVSFLWHAPRPTSRTGTRSTSGPPQPGSRTPNSASSFTGAFTRCRPMRR
jgi:hypothetical protein